MISRTVVAAFAIAVGICGCVAHAPIKDDDTVSVKVDYSDLNLSTEEGSRALYTRLVDAAEQVCPERADTLLALRYNRDAESCITHTVQRAVREIENPVLAEIAAARMR